MKQYQNHFYLQAALIGWMRKRHVLCKLLLNNKNDNGHSRTVDFAGEGMYFFDDKIRKADSVNKNNLLRTKF